MKLAAVTLRDGQSQASAGASQPSRSRKLRQWRLWLVGVLVVSTVAIIGGIARDHHLYPYGHSHNCTKGLGFSLLEYARDHDGFFPRGGPSPEASLGSLYSNYASAHLLSGKTVPVKVVEQKLATGEPLDPVSCGWHYVEGLHEDDDPGIAIAWDRVPGLNHFGRRAKGGGREVVFIGGYTEWIPGHQWENFVQHQRTLLANRPETLKQSIPALTITLRMPDGQVVTNYPGTISADAEYRYPDGSQSTRGIPGRLHWYAFPQDVSSVKIVIQFPDLGLRSETPSLKLHNGVPETNSVLVLLERN